MHFCLPRRTSIMSAPVTCTVSWAAHSLLFFREIAHWCTLLDLTLCAPTSLQLRLLGGHFFRHVGLLEILLALRKCTSKRLLAQSWVEAHPLHWYSLQRAAAAKRVAAGPSRRRPTWAPHLFLPSKSLRTGRPLRAQARGCEVGFRTAKTSV